MEQELLTIQPTKNSRRVNLYYKQVAKRIDQSGETATNALIFISGYARTLLQVFIRRNFGERYFSLWSTVPILMFLVIVPAIPKWYQSMRNPMSLSGPRGQTEGDVSGFITWYLFALAFLVFSIWRETEIKRSRSSFDFKKYSLYSGTILPFFMGLKGKRFWLWTVNIRHIEIFIEPAGFFVLGFLLYIVFGQYLGILLMVAAALYTFGYRAIYALGDDFVLDLVDNEIASSTRLQDVLKGRSPNGFEMRGGTPDSEESANRLSELMTREEQIFVAE